MAKQQQDDSLSANLWAVVLVRPFGGTVFDGPWYEIARFMIPSDGALRVAAEFREMTFSDGAVAYGISASRERFSPCVSLCSLGRRVMQCDCVNVTIDIGTRVVESAFGFRQMLGKSGLYHLTSAYHRLIAALPATIDVLPMPAPPPLPVLASKSAPRKRTTTKPRAAPARKRKA